MRGDEPDGDAGASGICALCERAVPALTRHHLRPREHGGRETAALCPGCHHQLHALYTNRTLAMELDSLEKLRRQPEVRRYLAWARKQRSPFRVRSSRSRR